MAAELVSLGLGANALASHSVPAKVDGVVQYDRLPTKEDLEKILQGNFDIHNPAMRIFNETAIQKSLNNLVFNGMGTDANVVYAAYREKDSKDRPLSPYSSDFTKPGVTKRPIHNTTQFEDLRTSLQGKDNKPVYAVDEWKEIIQEFCEREYGVSLQKDEIIYHQGYRAPQRNGTPTWVPGDFTVKGGKAQELLKNKKGFPESPVSESTVYGGEYHIKILENTEVRLPAKQLGYGNLPGDMPPDAPEAPNAPPMFSGEKIVVQEGQPIPKETHYVQVQDPDIKDLDNLGIKLTGVVKNGHEDQSTESLSDVLRVKYSNHFVGKGAGGRKYAVVQYEITSFDNKVPIGSAGTYDLEFLVKDGNKGHERKAVVRLDVTPAPVVEKPKEPVVKGDVMVYGGRLTPQGDVTDVSGSNGGGIDASLELAGRHNLNAGATFFNGSQEKTSMYGIGDFQIFPVTKHHKGGFRLGMTAGGASNVIPSKLYNPEKDVAAAKETVANIGIGPVVGYNGIDLAFMLAKLNHYSNLPGASTAKPTGITNSVLTYHNGKWTVGAGAHTRGANTILEDGKNFQIYAGLGISPELIRNMSTKGTFGIKNYHGLNVQNGAVAGFRNDHEPQRLDVYGNGSRGSDRNTFFAGGGAHGWSGFVVYAVNKQGNVVQAPFVVDDEGKTLVDTQGGNVLKFERTSDVMAGITKYIGLGKNTQIYVGVMGGKDKDAKTALGTLGINF
ncbi:hypothetical protein JXA85_04180 [Candidatus Woesearchaeota archaeon]|nr:hypothetical protein [Candidatus Woesearchaeota archaeon]